MTIRWSTESEGEQPKAPTPETGVDQGSATSGEISKAKTAAATRAAISRARLSAEQLERLLEKITALGGKSELRTTDNPFGLSDERVKEINAVDGDPKAVRTDNPLGLSDERLDEIFNVMGRRRLVTPSNPYGLSPEQLEKIAAVGGHPTVVRGNNPSGLSTERVRTIYTLGGDPTVVTTFNPYGLSARHLREIDVLGGDPTAVITFNPYGFSAGRSNMELSPEEVELIVQPPVLSPKRLEEITYFKGDPMAVTEFNRCGLSAKHLREIDDDGGSPARVSLSNLYGLSEEALRNGRADTDRNLDEAAQAAVDAGSGDPVPSAEAVEQNTGSNRNKILAALGLAFVLAGGSVVAHQSGLFGGEQEKDPAAETEPAKAPASAPEADTNKVPAKNDTQAEPEEALETQEVMYAGFAIPRELEEVKSHVEGLLADLDSGAKSYEEVDVELEGLLAALEQSKSNFSQNREAWRQSHGAAKLWDIHSALKNNITLKKRAKNPDNSETPDRKIRNAVGPITEIIRKGGK